MTIVLCGGGTAGHITPLLAVARELRRSNPNVRLVYIGEQNGKFSNVVLRGRVFDDIKLIPAGKFRRYHGQSWLAKCTDISTLMFNIRDFFRFLAGIVFSIWLIGRLKPEAMFLKGGFVCVPVSFAARIFGVPYVTHDSDVLPGLANRIAARGASYHATALSPDFYPYPKGSIREVGVPIDERFQAVDSKDRKQAKNGLGLREADPVLFVTGGSSGAKRLNKAIIQILPELIAKYPKLQVVHQVGAGNEHQYSKVPEKNQKNVNFFGVTAEQHRFSAAADIIVTRAGATALSEFAAQGKACIIVPNPLLTGGHQVKNAEVFQQIGAAIVLQEDDIKKDARMLQMAISDLLDNPAKREQLATKLHTTHAGKQAAREISKLILEVAI